MNLVWTLCREKDKKIWEGDKSWQHCWLPALSVCRCGSNEHAESTSQQPQFRLPHRVVHCCGKAGDGQELQRHHPHLSKIQWCCFKFHRCLLEKQFPMHTCGYWIQGLPKVFSAGLDIMEMYGKSPEHCGEFWRAVQEIWLKLYSSHMVVIAAINVWINKSKKSAHMTRYLIILCSLFSTGFQSCSRLYASSNLWLQDNGGQPPLQHWP